MSRVVMKCFVILLLTTFFATSSLIPAANAAVIGTSTYLNTRDGISQAELQDLLARDDVRSRLVELGVDPDRVSERVSSLTQEELMQLQQNMNELPAGSDVLAILGALLVVLIILELLGVTNVFTSL